MININNIIVKRGGLLLLQSFMERGQALSLSACSLAELPKGGSRHSAKSRKLIDFMGVMLP